MGAAEKQIQQYRTGMLSCPKSVTFKWLQKKFELYSNKKERKDNLNTGNIKVLLQNKNAITIKIHFYMAISLKKIVNNCI